MPCAPIVVIDDRFPARFYAISKTRPKPAGPCLHCRARPGNKRRGLCFRCYYDLPVRVRYPRDPRYQSKGHPDSVRKGRMPSEPTDAAPGSEEKLRVLAERAARKERLFHPLDRSRLGHHDRKLKLLGEDDTPDYPADPEQKGEAVGSSRPARKGAKARLPRGGSKPMGDDDFKYPPEPHG